MRPQSRFASVFAVAFSLAAAAHADQFDLTYTFGGGEYSYGAGTTAEVTFDGTLNGNLITDVSDATLSLNNVSVGSVYAYSLGSGYWYSGSEVISLDGTQNNFGLFNVNDSPVLLGGETAYLLSITGSAATVYDGDYGLIEAYDVGYGDAYDETYNGVGLNASYTVTDLSAQTAPDGGMTIAMLGVALIGLAALRRKFALPTSPTSV